MFMVDHQNFFILGITGNVGTEFKELVDENQRIVGMTRRSRSWYISNPFSYIPNMFPSEGYGLTREMIENFSKYKIPGTKGILDVVKDMDFRFEEPMTFVDCTAEPNAELYWKILTQTPHSIVTPNKIPFLSWRGKYFIHLFPDTLDYQCTVMAGNGRVLPFVRQNKPKTIEAIFSGTNNYICTETENYRPVSEVVLETKEKRYSESNPAIDLSGFDVGSKLAIVLLTAGYKIGKINISPLVPEEHLHGDLEQLIDNLKQKVDHLFDRKVRSARNRGNVLRYVATYKNGKRRVCLKEVPKNSELGQTRGTMNIIIVTTDIYDEKKPYIVKAPGAGADITAANLMSEANRLYELSQLRNAS